MSKPNWHFAQNGHNCEVYEALDFVYKKVPGNGILDKIRRFWMRARMISETDRKSLKYLRSQANIYQEKEEHLAKYPYMVHPFSKFRKYYEFYLFLLIFAAFFVYPLDNILYFKYNRIHESHKWAICRITIHVLFYVDIFMTFFTGYWDYPRNIVVLRPDLVAMNYLQTYFITDVMASLPLHTIHGLLEMNEQIESYMVIVMFMRYFIILRMCRYRKYGSRLSVELKISTITHGYLVLFMTTIFFIYWMMCLDIHILVVFDDRNIREPENRRDLHLFIAMLYTAIIKFARAGYAIATEVMIGDTPFFWILNETVFFLLIVHFYSLYGLSYSKPKYDEMVFQLTEYMQNRRFPKYLQRRLMCYYEFRFQKSYFRESEILVALSGQLRQDLLMHSCNKLVSKVSFFKNLPVALLIRIVTSLTTEIFLPNDVIIINDTVGDCMYFIATGTVAVYTPLGFEAKHLEDGDHFGEIALVLQDRKRNANIVAVDVCELYRLNRKDFVKAIMPYPDLLFKIEEIAKGRIDDMDLMSKQPPEAKRFSIFPQFD